jgi:hypothetical protein
VDYLQAPLILEPPMTTLVPTLQRHDFQHLPHVVHQKLVNGPSEWAPWLTFADDSPHTRTLRAEGDADALREESARSLASMPYDIGVMAPSDSGAPFPMAILEGGEYASEQVLNPIAMRQMAEKLGCSRMIVGVPFRGVVMAVDMELPRPVMSQFMFFLSAQYFHARSQPLSPLALIVIDGVVCGQAPGMEEAGRGTDLGDPDEIPAEVTMTQEDGRWSVRAAGTDRKAVTDALQAALLPRLLAAAEPVELHIELVDLNLGPADTSSLGRVLRRAVMEQGREEPPMKEVRFTGPEGPLEDVLGDLPDVLVDAVAAIPVAVLLRTVDTEGDVQAQLEAMREIVTRVSGPFYQACVQTRGDSLDQMLPMLSQNPMAILQSLILTGRARGLTPHAAEANHLAIAVAQAVAYASEPGAADFASLSDGAQARVKAVAETMGITLS